MSDALLVSLLCLSARSERADSEITSLEFLFSGICPEKRSKCGNKAEGGGVGGREGVLGVDHWLVAKPRPRRAAAACGFLFLRKTTTKAGLSVPGRPLAASCLTHGPAVALIFKCQRSPHALFEPPSLPCRLLGAELHTCWTHAHCICVRDAGLTLGVNTDERRTGQRHAPTEVLFSRDRGSPRAAARHGTGWWGF